MGARHMHIGHKPDYYAGVEGGVCPKQALVVVSGGATAATPSASSHLPPRMSSGKLATPEGTLASSLFTAVLVVSRLVASYPTKFRFALARGTASSTNHDKGSPMEALPPVGAVRTLRGWATTAPPPPMQTHSDARALRHEGNWN